MAEKSVQNVPGGSLAGVGKLPHATIQFTLGENVTKENITALLDHAFELAGCRTCGLNGIDIVLHRGDPEITKQFANIAAVKNVSVFR
jgi:hypothetical protein